MSWQIFADRSSWMEPCVHDMVACCGFLGARALFDRVAETRCDPMRGGEERRGMGRKRAKRNIPLGTTHTPPLEMANSFVSASPLETPRPFCSTAGGPTVTRTLPSCTKNTICILREFFARLKPSGGNSTMPEPKNGRVIILAYWKDDPATSRVTIDDEAKAISVTKN